MCQLLILTFFRGFSAPEPVSREVQGHFPNSDEQNIPQVYEMSLTASGFPPNRIAANGDWMHQRAKMTPERRGENWAKPLFTHADPTLQISGFAQQCDAGLLQFKACVLQAVEAFIHLVVGILHILQSGAAGVDANLERG